MTCKCVSPVPITNHTSGTPHQVHHKKSKIEVFSVTSWPNKSQPQHTLTHRHTPGVLRCICALHSSDVTNALCVPEGASLSVHPSITPLLHALTHIDFIFIVHFVSRVSKISHCNPVILHRNVYAVLLCPVIFLSYPKHVSILLMNSLFSPGRAEQKKKKSRWWVKKTNLYVLSKTWWWLSKLESLRGLCS